MTKKTEKDNFIQMRKLLMRRSYLATRKIKSVSARVLAFDLEEDREPLFKVQGEAIGLGYALKVLDKVCQVEMAL